MREGHQVARSILACVLAAFVLRSAAGSEAAAASGVRRQSDAQEFVGRPAPRIDPGLSIGPRSPSAVDRSPALLLFFWAHWCPECKAEAPIVAKLLEKYRQRGLAIVAPTRRYGFVENGRPAAPEKELRHIVDVRDAAYPFLRREPVPVGDANHRSYGVDAVPTNVLIDRHGVIRLYHTGRMTEPDLERAILDTIER